MIATELASVVRSSAYPLDLVNQAGDEYMIGEELTIREDEATKDDIILYHVETGTVVADGGYLATAEEAIKLGLYLVS